MTIETCGRSGLWFMLEPRYPHTAVASSLTESYPLKLARDYQPSWVFHINCFHCYYQKANPASTAEENINVSKRPARLSPWDCGRTRASSAGHTRPTSHFSLFLGPCFPMNCLPLRHHSLLTWRSAMVKGKTNWAPQRYTMEGQPTSNHCTKA